MFENSPLTESWEELPLSETITDEISQIAGYEGRL